MKLGTLHISRLVDSINTQSTVSVRADVERSEHYAERHIQCEQLTRGGSDIQAFQPGLKGNRNAKTCLIIGDCSSSMDVCNALNFWTGLPAVKVYMGKIV